MNEELSCPSCGAPVDVDNRFTRMVKCDYCDGQLLLEGEAFEFQGEAKLAPGSSRFDVGQEGTVKDRSYRVLGHIRYNWGRGFWDEYCVKLEGEEMAWIADDAGELTISRKVDPGETPPSYEEVQVGGKMSVGDYSFVVSEKGEAEVEGFEGELPFVAKAGDGIQYVDGSHEGNVYSIEYEPQEILFFEGVSLRQEDLDSKSE